MNTGCTGPYAHGTGGWCGCNCRCCPPSPCCPVVSVYFEVGTNCVGGGYLLSPHAIPPSLANWEVPEQQLPPLPEFSKSLVYSKDRKFKLGNGSIPCSVPIPCETICVEVSCGDITPCCCVELTDGQMYAAGNGYVTAPTTVPTDNGCGYLNVYINGSPSPVFMSDGEAINITLEADDPYCCEIEPIDMQCQPCPVEYRAKAPLFRRKIDPRTGKTNINPKTGKPLIVIDKNELKKRILQASRKRRS